ncbi:MAG TPA: hypothetical protein VE575_17465 [Acidimicrobiales bacterium]|jgi:hypothetical protein|nr:hypothetical protein [Acidimicrobiales bacterium]
MDSGRPKQPGERKVGLEPTLGAGFLGDGLGGRLERWAAEARVDEAARRRTRERWLRQQAEEEGRLAGVLADLAERGNPVAVHARSGRRYRGDVRAVGRDFVALRTAAVDAMLRLGAVTSVRAGPGAVPSVGDRSVRTSLSWSEVLTRLAAERTSVVLVVGDGSDAVAGELRSVGQDVVLVRPEGDPRSTTYVPLGAITEVVLER